jgi:hypothetical protein
MAHQEECINYLLQRIKALEKENARLLREIQQLKNIKFV